MSKILYKTLGTPPIRKILYDLRQASSELGIDFFGIGALARNVWFLTNQEQSRGTKDLDFAVYVPNLATYQALKAKLVDDYSYTITANNDFCLISPPPDQVPLDLLPFEAIEGQENDILTIKTILSVNLDGFLEVYTNGLIDVEIEGDTFQVCSIPSVVVLKLISYDDRPENRPNDPIDINAILQYYPDLETEMIWEEYTFLYETDEEELSPYNIGIKVLGYEVGKIISKNQRLTKRILTILQQAIQLESNLAERMIQDAVEETVENKCRLLTLLKDGITEQLSKEFLQ
ncbi:MAG: hypothetical protein ACRBFS_23380 [Aureispira sp.]